MQLPKIYKFCARYPKITFVLAAMLTFLSLWTSGKLGIESDFSALLPTHTTSIENIKEMKKYFGSSGYLFVTLQGPQKEETKKFAEQLATEIEKNKEVAYVDRKQPVDFFKDRIWLFLELNDLQEMEQRTEKGLQLQSEGINPMMGRWLSVADQEDMPDLTFKDIISKYEKRSGLKFNETHSSSDSSNEQPLTVLRVKLNQGKHQQLSIENLQKEIREAEKQIKKNTSYAEISIDFTGEYQTSLEQANYAEKEIQKSTVLVVFLLTLALVLYFRDFKGVFLVGIPLFIGIVWTGGAIYLFLGHLNVITAFAGAILGGLGSDYGIYLLTRFYHERKKGCSFDKSLDLTFSNQGTAKATYASMLCMVAVFAALGFSDFGVFVEFAITGAIGLIANYIAMISLLPAWLSYRNKSLLSHNPQVSSVTIDAEQENISKSKMVFVLYPYAPKLILLLVLGLALVSATTISKQSKIYFEDGNMENRDLPATRLYNKVSEQMQASLSPTLLMVKGIENEEKLLEKLQKKLKESSEGELVYNDVIGISTFLPKDQKLKKELLQSLIEKYSKLNLIWNKKKESFLESLKTSSESSEIFRENLPAEIVRMFQSSKDPNVFVLYLFPAFGRGSLENMTRYTQAVMALKDELKMDIVAVDGTFVEHDIIQLIQKEAPRGLLFILLSLTAILLWSVRPFSRALVIAGCLVLSLVLMSGLLSWMKVPLNILNIGVFPVILGTGVNCFIHFAHRLDELGDMKRTLQSYMSAILTSDLTTVIGFSGLLFTPSEGLRSVGWVAVIGLSLVTLVCVVVFPRWLELEKSIFNRRSM